MSQPAGTITGTPLTIGNTGTSALDWTIGEAPVVTTEGADLATVDPDAAATAARRRAAGAQHRRSRGGGVRPARPATCSTRRSSRIRQSLGTTTHIILNAAQDGFLVSSQSENVVHAFDLDGVYQGVFAPIGGEDTSIMGNIRGMTISPRGTLLVTSATGNKVVEFDAERRAPRRLHRVGRGRHQRAVVRAVPRGRRAGLRQRRQHLPVRPRRHAAVGLAERQSTSRSSSTGRPTATCWRPRSPAPAGVWELDPDGALVGRYTGVASNRGVCPLGNGNILTTNSGGVHEIDRGSALIETELRRHRGPDDQ